MIDIIETGLNPFLFWWLVANGVTSYLAITAIDNTPCTPEQASSRIRMAENPFWVAVVGFLMAIPLLLLGAIIGVVQSCRRD